MRLSPLIATALGALLLAAPAAAQAPTSRPKITQPPPGMTPEPAKKPAAQNPAAARPGATPDLGSGMAYLQGVAVDSIHGVPLVNAMKGIEQNTLELPSQILCSVLPQELNAQLTFLSGPSFASLTCV